MPVSNVPGSSRVALVGFDGATWTLLDKLMAEGTMPNLQRLRGESLRGVLRSCIPPVTAPAWTSMVTGKNPGKHSVFDFFHLGDSISDIRVVDSSNVKAPTVFEILERRGMKAVIINLPLSWPPKTSFPTLGNFMTPASELVLPKSLLDYPDFQGYAAYPKRVEGATPGEMAVEMRRVEAARFRAAKALFKEEWDLFFVMFSAADWIQHMAFGRLLNESEDDDIASAKQVYADLDGYLGWFGSQLRDEDYLILASDHGFFQAEGVFSIDAFLTRRGLLTQKAVPKSTSINKSSENTRGKSMGLPTGAVDFLIRRKRIWPALQWMFEHVATRWVEFEGHIIPDPGRTKAAGAGTIMGIVVNRKTRFESGLLDESEADQVKKELLQDLRSYGNGELFDVRSAEESYSGPFLAEAPDIQLIPKKYAVTNVGLKEVYPKPRNHHHPDGILMIHGPGVVPGTRDAEIYDVFPTILTMLNVPVPADADGRTLVGKEVRTKEEPHKTTKRGISSSDEDEIMKRLEDLGYI
jgi:predicted AlkP superfamily phosphohydrolase/phosphomutase